MSEQDNRALVQQGYDAFGRGDIEALLALLDETSNGSPQGHLTCQRRGVARSSAGRGVLQGRGQPL